MKKNIRKKSSGHAIKNSLNGINYAIEKEHNLLYIMFYIILILILSILFKTELYEILILVVCFGITFSLELVNTSIEALTDLVTTKERELAKVTKDSASAALFIMVIITAISTLIIFVPKILESMGII